MIDISIDIETLSSDPRGASIASIGVAAANLSRMSDPWTYHWTVDDPHGIITPKTVRWHAEQTGDTLGKDKDAWHIRDALQDLYTTLTGHLKLNFEGESRIWSHATFDIPQIACAYERCGMEVPWHYRNCRDLRTLYDLAGGRPQVENLNKHSSLADAICQLEEIRLCLTQLKKL